MNKEQLRELVKAHFNLVDHTPVVTEEKFGEIFDENKAFKIVFPGDTLKVGDEVRVVTTDGQESDAPDGFHKLIDGTVIKTEGSSVVEIESPEGKSEEEMNEEDGLGAVEDKANKAVEEAFAAKEDISEVQGTTPQNAVTETNVPVSTLTGPVKTEAEVEAEMMKKVKMAIDESIASEIAGIKEEMKAMKTKMEEFMMSPAKEKTMAAAGKVKMEAFSTATNDTALKVARELLKNKRK
jgi:rRNA-processing protein FCF1